MTDNLFRWNWRQKKSVIVNVTLEEQKVVQSVKENMNMISNVNTVVNSYFYCENIFRSFMSVASERSFSRSSLL